MRSEVIIFKSNPNKINGKMGKRRMRIYNFSLCGISAIIVIPCLYLTFTVNIFFYHITVLSWISINLFYWEYKRRRKKINDFRLLSKEEWQRYKSKNLIHYSNVLEFNDGINDVVIPAHYSFKVNHLLPNEYRHKGFVWFHLCDSKDNNEPTLESFLNAHFGEGNPRKKKLIVQLEQLPKDKVYIHLKTGYIVVEGNLEIEAMVINKFKWFNDKIYLSYILSNVWCDVLFVFYNTFIHLKLRIKDWKKDKKVVSDI